MYVVCMYSMYEITCFFFLCVIVYMYLCMAQYINECLCVFITYVCMYVLYVCQLLLPKSSRIGTGMTPLTIHFPSSLHHKIVRSALSLLIHTYISMLTSVGRSSSPVRGRNTVSTPQQRKSYSFDCLITPT